MFRVDAESDLVAARRGDSAAFDRVVDRHRRELYVHCYRMLGSVQDAEDALQEALLAAWRGIGGFEGRSSLRAWLYRICTNACLRQAAGRPRRALTPDHYPARLDVHDLGDPVLAPIWIEPLLDEPAPDADPALRYDQRETVELAFVAALQHLPGTQRAVLILREVLQFSAAEVATVLDTTPASVNSALQRARKTIEERVPTTSQAAELDALGDAGQRELVDAFVAAWERADIAALQELLVADARFTMPPLPAWFDGIVDVSRFLTERVFALQWRLEPIRVNGQLGFVGYSREPGAGPYQLAGVNALSVRDGRIAEIDSFLDPTLHAVFRLPASRV
jgi:RNA polymerase sigma-70 factor (TIGR02960 family)